MITYSGRLRWHTAISKADNNSEVTSSQFLVDCKKEQITAGRMTARGAGAGAGADLDWKNNVALRKPVQFRIYLSLHHTIYTVRSKCDHKKSFTLLPWLHADNILHSLGSILFLKASRKKSLILSYPSALPSLGQSTPGLRETILASASLTCCDWFPII